MIVTLKFNLNDSNEEVFVEKENLQAALLGRKYKNKIDSLYDEVFRPHLKYGQPIGDYQKLKEREIEIITILWLKINDHFNLQ